MPAQIQYMHTMRAAVSIMLLCSILILFMAVFYSYLPTMSIGYIKNAPTSKSIYGMMVPWQESN